MRGKIIIPDFWDSSPPVALLLVCVTSFCRPLLKSLRRFAPCWGLHRPRPVAALGSAAVFLRFAQERLRPVAALGRALLRKKYAGSAAPYPGGNRMKLAALDCGAVSR